MTRYAGIKNDSIYVVSDNSFTNDDLEVIELPANLTHISSEELITSFRYKNNQFRSKNVTQPAKELKVAFVSNLWMQCGLATYAENLYPEIIKHIGDFRVFMEDNDVIPTNIIANDKVISCWKRGQPLNELANQIKLYDPDVIIVNHEWGLFPDAKYFMSFMTQISSYRVIVTMHSIFPNHSDKIIVEAVIPEMIVHLDGAKLNLLNDKKISGKVIVIPHGCYEITNQDRLWNIYKSNHTFIQSGFGFEYKNFESSIIAASILKTKYEGVFFTALISESPFNKIGHTIYFNKLMDLVIKYNLQDSVALIRGYQSDIVLSSYLRTNQVGVFPYTSVPNHEVFGASGAARLAMSFGIPVITSSIPHFSDLNTIKADTPEQIAEELSKLFSDEALKRTQVEKQNQFIIENSWANTALKYIAVIENTLI